MELADMRDLGSRAERRAGSTPVTRTRVGASFMSLAPTLYAYGKKVRAHSFRCSFFQTRTRYAGFRVCFWEEICGLEMKLILACPERVAQCVLVLKRKTLYGTALFVRKNMMGAQLCG